MPTMEAPKRRRGRQPALPEERQEILTTRVRPRYLRALEEEAEETGISLSEAARHVIETWGETRARLEAEAGGEAVKAASDWGRRAAEALHGLGFSYEQILCAVGQGAREALAAEERKARSRRWRVMDEPQKAETPGCS
jgi:hypothetical protein